MNGWCRSGHKIRNVPLVWRLYAVLLNICVQLLGLIGTLVPFAELSKWTYWVLPYLPASPLHPNRFAQFPALSRLLPKPPHLLFMEICTISLFYLHTHVHTCNDTGA